MSYANITKDNLLSQAWTNIYDTINNRTYIPDPISPGGGRKFVYTRIPNIKSPGFQGFPFIVLSQPIVLQDRESINYKRKDVIHTITLTIFSTDRANNNQNPGDGIRYLNLISDDVISIFNSDTVKELLRPFGIENLNIDNSSSDVDDLEEDVVFNRVFEINFKKRLDVF